jgi:hypothetical protein
MRCTHPIHPGTFMQKGMMTVSEKVKLKNSFRRSLCASGLIENGFQGKEGQHVPEMTDQL